MKNLTFLESTIKMPLMELPVRTVFVKLQTARLLLSPGTELTPDQLSSVDGVTHLVGPNLFHCAGIPKAKAIFPQAEIWGVKDAKTIKPEIPWTLEFDEASWPFHIKI